MRRTGRIGLVVAALLAATTTAPVLLATPAEAASYRFWTYWGVPDGGSEWQFAQTGASRSPKDGSVEGWRFAISPSTRAAPPPRVPAEGAFDDVCGGGGSAPDGKKRIALYVDFGTAADAPRGSTRPGSVHKECAVVPVATTGLQLLTELGFGPVRTKSGMVCGISGYPTTGCGDPVADPSPRTSAPSRPDGPSRSTRPKSDAADAPNRKQTASPRGDAAASTAPRAAQGSTSAGSSRTGVAAKPSGAASASVPNTTTDPSPSDAPAVDSTATPPAEEADRTADVDRPDEDEVVVVEGAPSTDSSGNSPVTLALAVAAVVLLAGSALWRARRSRTR